MISVRTLAAASATAAAVVALGGAAVGAWGPQPKPPETVAETPIVITDVRTVRKTVHVKSKAHRGVRPAASSAGSPRAYAVSNPPAPTYEYASRSSSTGQSQRGNSSAPTVSTHSSGGSHGAEYESGEREDHHDGESEDED